VLSPRTEVSTETPWLRPLLPWAVGLLVVVVTFLGFAHRIDAERRDFVERRLRASAELLTASAREVLAGRATREGLASRMQDLGAATDVRITLVLPNGEVLAESEVRDRMPNLADRTEVREAQAHGLSTASRKSAMTGKETLYLAVGIDENGARIGTLRVATDSAEVREVLGRLEYELAAIVAIALLVGAWIGRRLARPSIAEAPRETTRESPTLRRAA